MTRKKKAKKQKRSSGNKKLMKGNISSDKPLSDTENGFKKAVSYHQAGQFQQAEDCYKKILEISPDHSDALHLLGVLSHQTGKKDIAADLIYEAIRISPGYPNYHNNLGIVFQEKGELDEAISCYKKALELKPDFADAYNNMGFALQDQRKPDEAISCYQKALQIRPGYAEAFNNMGTAFKDAGKTDDAISCYQNAVQLKPDYAEAYNNMGAALRDQDRFNEAMACWHKTLEIKPDYAEVYNSMGAALRNQGRFSEALSCCQKALDLKPDFADAFNNMGTVLKDQGSLNESVACCQRALQLKPDNFVAWVSLGNTFQDQGKFDEAVSCYQNALKIKPDHALAYDNMRNAYIYQGKLAEAVSCCEKSLKIRPDSGTEVRKALMLPVIYESREEIGYYREKVIKEIESLRNKRITLSDPHKQVGSTNFYLAYHGLNDRDIQKEIASFYIHACPDIAWTNPKLSDFGHQASNIQHQASSIKHPASNIQHQTSNIQHQTSNIQHPASNIQHPITIGIASMHLYNLHQQTIGKLNRGIVQNLSREKFRVKLFRFPGGENSLIKSVSESADEIVDLPTELKPAREIIAKHALDVLFYPDIGMDSLTYFLAFSRLAPVQCVTWGHPVTTGIPNMDYFISSEHLEPPGAKGHYSERLVLLKRLPVYYYRPETPETAPSREKFGFPEDCNLYVCPQAPFKFHPDFDLALGNILRRDPRGVLVLIEGQTFEHWGKLLLNRFRKTFPDAIDRVRFLKAMPTKDFLCLLMVADALLEPPYFGGGNTTYESFACGVPIVTWPGPFMRGRVTLGCYRQMGVADCVAGDAQSYTDIAFRLANDKTWRDEIKTKIRANAHAIFEDMEAIHELERFFEGAVRLG